METAPETDEIIEFDQIQHAQKELILELTDQVIDLDN